MVHLLLAVIYLSFISLGLPDSLLGSAWPVMYGDLQVPVSYAGMISMVIAAGTIASSLQSDRLTRRFGTGAVTTASVVTTAAALFGFSVSRSFPALIFWAIPYGLGAGSVDASLNNFVALHYESRHMSWLHCMWGIGASVGPCIMGMALSGGHGWSMGYRAVGMIQAVLSVILVLSLPLWKRKAGESRAAAEGPTSGEYRAAAEGPAAGESRTLSLGEMFRIRGVTEVLLMFFCYCALEGTVMLWSGSFFALCDGFPETTAAGYAGLFYIGIMAGRVAAGFLTKWFGDDAMIRLGEGILAAGILTLMIPMRGIHPAGMIFVGLGCAPIYPSVIHSTPARFGAEKSQAVIGVQMASAYLGNLMMPPVFGILANRINASLFPYYLILILMVMALMHEKLCRTLR